MNLLYAVNSSTQTLSQNDAVNFGSIARKCGCSCNLSGGNITLTGAGYYDIDVNLSLAESTGTEATITIYKDGVAVPGASSTIDLTVLGSVTIPAIVRNTCCKQSEITAVVNSAVTVNNASIVVKKVQA